MKIIFLDIDGVLNTMRMEDRPLPEYSVSNSGIRYRYFTDIPIERCVKNLNRILKETNAEIVISSTWRILHSVPSLMYIFFMCGIRPPFILGATPHTGKCRGFEIDDWLKENPEVERFTILDDDRDMEHLMDHLVHVNSEIGLTDADANKAIAMLNKE